MSDFDRRISELSGLLAAAAAPPGADPPVVNALQQAIAGWGDRRRDLLEALAEMVERATPSTAPLEKRWPERVGAARQELSRLFGDAVKDRVLSPAVQLFFYQALAHEQMFLESLTAVRTPGLIDTLLAHQKRHGELVLSLQDKWRFLLDLNTRLETDERKAIEAADKVVQEAVQSLDGPLRDLVERLVKVQSAITKGVEKVRQLAIELIKQGIEALFGAQLPAEADVVIEDAMRQAENYAEMLKVQIALYRQNLQVYRQLVATERGAVLTLFQANRREVERYLQENDLGKAQVWRDQALGLLDDWAGRLPTDGQQDDGEALFERVEEAVDEIWDTTAGFDQQFRKEFEGVFVGALGGATIERLAELALFEGLTKGLAGRGADRALAEWRERLPKDVQQQYQAAMNALDDGIKGFEVSARELALTESAAFREHLKERLQGIAEQLLPVIEDLRTTFAPDQVRRDWGREELADELT